MDNASELKVVAVIPCYRVSRFIENVLVGLQGVVSHAIVVDDACPENTGQFVESLGLPGVTVTYHEKNKGVGGAVCTGYQAALALGADIVVKVDGDGQMDATLIPNLIAPILLGDADYVKGNRFASLTFVRRMPFARRVGNIGLSFITKFSTGYYNIMDPTNGFTAIQAAVLHQLELHKLAERYFFESDMLFRLSLLRAVVRDMPMHPVYLEDGVSSLKVGKALGEFSLGHMKRLAKRIFYNYFFRDFNYGSMQLLVALICLGFGITFGLLHWSRSIGSDVPATAGTVMLSALPIIVGFQSLLSAIHFDIAQVPQHVLHTLLPKPGRKVVHPRNQVAV